MFFYYCYLNILYTNWLLLFYSLNIIEFLYNITAGIRRTYDAYAVHGILMNRFPTIT